MKPDEVNQEILAELRKTRSLNQRIFYLMLVFVILTVLSFPIFRPSRSSPKGESWNRVTTAIERQDFPEALAVAQSLVARQPNYNYGHIYLGGIYLAMNDVTNAEVHYSRAYELFPDEESRKNLTAVRKRLATMNDFKLLSK